jgi:pentapeptide MXKDX repeat protein
MMKKFLFLLATVTAIGVAAPTIASAQDKPMMKEGMKDDGMAKPIMHHHRHHHHHMKKLMMKKDGM